jgi:hypothetical protein
MALDEIGVAHERRLTYDLPNGSNVTYAGTERSYYITSIVSSIFKYDSYVRRIVMGLAGNNLRRAFEIFVEFCTSGHIGEGEILRVRQSKGEYALPLDAVMTVLLRANRRYYESDTSFITNILNLYEQDDHPNHFTRMMILSYLRARMSESGPSGLKGYFSLAQLQDDLGIYGLSVSVTKRELNYLVRSECVISESLSQGGISDQDLFKLGPVGFVHLELLGLAEYWAAIAEDTGLDSRPIAKRIADRIVVRETHYTPGVSLQNGRAAYDYIHTVRAKAAEASAAVLAQSRFFELTDIEAGEQALVDKSRSIQGGVWYDAAERFYPGAEVGGTVINADQNCGLFVEIAPGITGLLHRSRLPGGALTESSPKIGKEVRVRVLKIEPERRRISFGLGASPSR